MLSRNSRNSGAAVAALAVLIAAGLAACGGSADSPAGPSAPVIDSSAPTAVLSETFADVPAGGERFATFSLPRRGTLALTVRWNDQNNSVVAILTGQGCTNFRNAAADCQVRRSVGRHGKEGQEQFIDYPGASGAYFLTVQNLGPGTESIQVNAELTSAAAAPVPPTPRPTERPDRRAPDPRSSGKP